MLLAHPVNYWYNVVREKRASVFVAPPAKAGRESVQAALHFTEAINVMDDKKRKTPDSGRMYRSAYPKRLFHTRRLDRLRTAAGPYCPRCGAEAVRKTAAEERYRCLRCGKSFSFSEIPERKKREDKESSASLPEE